VFVEAAENLPLNIIKAVRLRQLQLVGGPHHAKEQISDKVIQ
jgi:hypothetical protein